MGSNSSNCRLAAKELHLRPRNCYKTELWPKLMLQPSKGSTPSDTRLHHGCALVSAFTWKRSDPPQLYPPWVSRRLVWPWCSSSRTQFHSPCQLPQTQYGSSILNKSNPTQEKNLWRTWSPKRYGNKSVQTWMHIMNGNSRVSEWPRHHWPKCNGAPGVLRIWQL